MSELPPQEIDLVRELRELGEQLKKAIQVARDHPQTKEFERQVSQAVTDLGAHIDRALKSAIRGGAFLTSQKQEAGTHVPRLFFFQCGV